MVKPEREISNGGVIIKKYRDNIRILLIKDPFGKWTWPKGKIDKGETALDAAIREIGEETGLNNIEHISRVGQVNYYYRRHRLIYKTVHLYLFKFFGKETLSIKKDEIDDGKWFSDKEALSIVEYDGAKKLLSKAIKIYRKRAENRNGG